ncbi:hypothetical protein [Nocardia fluminea]|uniref:hypothetical protein n=1 Tax=Nocardia fluminea TaxID=134984 RepID=UPI003648A8C5
MNNTTTQTETREPWIFVLRRDTDISGYSGTGDIADGVVFADGTVAMHWRDRDGRASGTVVAPNIRHIIEPHGHDGFTRVVWVSGGPVIERAGRITDSLCGVCWAPMMQVFLDDSVIYSEGQCVDCGLREVWELAS